MKLGPEWVITAQDIQSGLTGLVSKCRLEIKLGPTTHIYGSAHFTPGRAKSGKL